MNGYKEIAIAVTLQMIADYYKGLCSQKEMEYYINNSPFFAILNIDEKRAIRLLRENKEKRDGKKKKHKNS